jgi:hypothetical protein
MVCCYLSLTALPMWLLKIQWQTWVAAVTADVKCTGYTCCHYCGVKVAPMP